MNRIVPRGPLGQKAAKPAKNSAHMAKVSALPCCICVAFGIRQTTRTTVHHVIHGRFSQRKVPDEMTIPLCVEHHLGPEGVHANPAKWKRLYGEDHTYIAQTLDKIEALT